VLIEGSLCLDESYALGDFQYRESIKPFDLFHFERGCGRWHAVGKAIAAGSEEEAFARTLHPALDVATVVVLEGADTADVRASADVSDEDSPIEVLSDLPAATRLRVTRRQPGWVVLTQPWYPGWVA
jgi:hypothetical protein